MKFQLGQTKKIWRFGMGNKWNEEALHNIKQSFEEGTKVAELAVRYGVSRVRIYQLLKKAGVVVRGKQANLGPETEASIIQIEETANAY